MLFCVNKNPFSKKKPFERTAFFVAFFHYDDEKNETAII